MSDTVITNYATAVTVDGDQVAVEISPNGAPGPPGQGVPAGGGAGQVLKKASGADFHTEWGDDTEGVQSVQGDGVDNTDPANPVLTFPTAGEIGAIPTTEKGAANGVATLGADGYVTEEQVFPYPDNHFLTRGRYFRAPFLPSTQTVDSNLYVAHFIFVASTIPVSEVGINIINAGSSNGSARIGVYGPYTDLDITNIQGKSLIIDTGVIPINTTGYIGVTVDEQLTRGWYAVMVVTNRALTVDFSATVYGNNTQFGMTQGYILIPQVPAGLYPATSISPTAPSTADSLPATFPNKLMDGTSPGVNSSLMVIFRRKVT